MDIAFDKQKKKTVLIANEGLTRAGVSGAAELLAARSVEERDLVYHIIETA